MKNFTPGLSAALEPEVSEDWFWFYSCTRVSCRDKAQPKAKPGLGNAGIPQERESVPRILCRTGWNIQSQSRGPLGSTCRAKNAEKTGIKLSQFQPFL